MSTSAEIQEAIDAERQAAKKLDLSGRMPYFIASLVLFVVFLVIKFDSHARGYELLVSPRGVSVMELIFIYFSTALALGTAVTLITRLTKAGWVTWMLSGIATFTAIWALWALDSSDGPSLGFFALFAANLVALIGFSLVAMRKTPEQLAAQERVRQLSGQLDEVGQAQSQTRNAHTMQQQSIADANPLLVDDRRARAASRHHHEEEGR